MMAAENRFRPLTTERLEELLWQTIRGCSALEDRIEDLQRRLDTAEETISEQRGQIRALDQLAALQEKDIRDLQQWIGELSSDFLDSVQVA